MANDASPNTVNDKILGRIRSLVQNFDRQSVEIVPGYFFSQKNTLERIEKYYAGQFLTGDTDPEGFKKFFYNVSVSRCDVATKAIDLDTKDIRLQSEQRLRVWLMSKELRQWMRKQKIGKLLNRIVEFLPRYGTVVVKSVNGKPYVVDLKNIVCDQAADSLSQSDFVEKHVYTPEDLLQQPWDRAAIAQTIARYAKAKQSLITVYESYLWVPENWVYEDGDPSKITRWLCIASGLDLAINQPKKNLDEKNTVFEGIKLFQDVVREHNYKEVHFEKVAGRWLGRGIVEKLFDAQERINTLVNQQARTFQWTSKQVFQTRDRIAQKNLLTDALDGDVLNVDSDITKVGVEDRNLAAFREEMTRWESYCDRIAFSYEVSTGQSLPSGTPFRLAFIQQQAVASYFDLKREDIGLFLQELILDLILPEFKKDKKSAHKMIAEGGEEEMSLLREALVESHLIAEAARLAPRIRYYEDMEELIRRTKQKLGSKISLEIPDAFYENLELFVDVVITGEQVDSNSRITTLTTAMQTIGANPNIIRDPILRRVFARALDVAGEDSAEILAGADALPPLQAPQQVAGSVARAQAPDIVSQIKETRL